MIAVEESYAGERRQKRLGQLLPGGAAVVGAENDAAGGAGVWLTLPADGPAAMGIDKEDGVE